jgi:hypothetical protein
VLAHIAGHFQMLSNPEGLNMMSLFYPKQPIPPGMLPQPLPGMGPVPPAIAPPGGEKKEKPPEQVAPQPPKLEAASQRANQAEKASHSQGGILA